MGTHPIFESDFDCLTDEVKMNALRNSAYRLVTQMSVVKPTQLAARSIGAQMASHLTKSAASVGEHRQQQQQQPNLFTTSQKTNIGARFAQLNFNLPQTASFSNVSYASQMGGAMSRIFAAFDLMSVSVTLIGYIGDAAVWLVQDKLTGDVQYVIDDSV